MKKKILLFSFGLMISTITIAQTPVMTGNILFDPYFGIPTGNVLWNNGSGENYKVKGGQFAYGGRLEYMIADDLGIGVDVNYVKTGFSYDSLSVTSTYNATTGMYDIDSTSGLYDYTAQKTRIMVRINKHFVQTDNVDAYFGAAAGYRLVSRTTTFGGEPVTDQDEALIPVAFRLALGARFYFTQNIGAHIELGAFGGQIIEAGLAFKF